VAQLNFGNGFSIDLADAQKFVNALQALLDSLQYTLSTRAVDHPGFVGGREFCEG